MRKFTKSLLTLALLVFAVGGAKAGVQTVIKTVDYTTNPVKVDGANYYQSGYPWYWMGDAGDQPNCCGGTATAQLANGAFEINNTKAQTNNWDLQMFISDGFAIKVGYSYIIKVTMKADGDGSANLSFSSNWSASANKGINFTASDVYAEYTATIGKEDVTSKIAGNSGGHVVFQCGSFVGKVSIQKVVVIEEAPEIVTITEVEKFEAPSGTTDLNGMTGAGSIKWTVEYPQTMGPGIGWLGNIDGDDKSVDISTYDYLHFVVTEASADANLGLRVFVWDGSARQCLYPHPIAEAAGVSDWKTFSPITSTGTYVVKISGYPLLRGFKGGNSWQDGNAGTVVISQAYVSSGDPVAYVPTGKTTVSGKEYLDDENITCFDVTALISAGQTLNAANPNALFIANDGMVTNTKNVIVSGTCANLELTDGKPFKAPSAFTATAAKFTKTISAAGYGTMVIPFDAALATGVDAAYNLTGDDGSKVTYTDASSIAANKPVLVKAAAGNYDFTATSVELGATVDESTNGKLIGTYAGTTAVAGATNYVLQNGAAGLGFFLVTGTDATIKPFRAYLNTAAAASMLSLDFGDITGIDATELVKKAGNESFYNLNGQRVAQPAKGLYIVNGKKVVLK